MIFGIPKGITGVYRISLADGRSYIGSSVDVRQRWYVHRLQLNRNEHHSPYLQRAWNKYGEDSFTFEVVEECERSALIDVEQRWIDKCIPEFNALPTARSRLGVAHTEETKRKIGDANRGRSKSEETLRKLSESLTGRVVTAATREKISLALTGRSIPQESRAKMSVAKKGRVVSDEERRRFTERMTGRVVTAETRKKLSDANKGRVFSDEHRKKIGAASKGRVHSAETRAKISESLNAHYAEAKLAAAGAR